MLGKEDICMNKFKRQIVKMARNRLESVKQARETHRLNIKRSLEHRLRVAREKGDENLVRQLEAEMNYFS
jgi:hypothetical protein